MPTVNLHNILTVLLCFPTVSYALLEFDDPIHGELIQSREYPLFLTHKSQPELAYYIPTDEQFAEVSSERSLYSCKLCNRSKS